MKRNRRWLNIIILILVMLAVMIFSVSVGSANLSVWDSLRLFANKLPLVGDLIDVSDIGATYEIIVWKVRMPRIVLSALVGGALAVVGGVFQGVFGNSLADPHILGVSSGAALGATIGMLSGVTISFLSLGTVGICAFVGALVTVFLVYHLAKVGGEISTTNMLLTGTATSTMLSAIISLLMTFNEEQVDKVYMWTLGSFSAATWDKVSFLAIMVAVGVALLFAFAQKINVMMMGEEEAKSLGVDTVKVRRVVILISSFLVASAVSVSGIIGFVGLIIPHSVRMLTGSNNKSLLPYSFFGGATFLMLCDTAARTIAAPTEIPVGIITSVLGAPFFIFLILRSRKRV